MYEEPDWIRMAREEVAARKEATRRASPNFVEPYRPTPPLVRRVEVLPPDLPRGGPDYPVPVNVDARVSGSYEDRARGFRTATTPVAVVVGLVALLVGVVGFRTPLWSLTALLWLAAGFALVWLVAWVMYLAASSEGAALAHVLLAWRWLGREQRHRHDLEWSQFEERDE